VKGTLDRAVERYGDRPWLFFAGEMRSFRELGDRVERTAAALYALGVEQRDRLGLFCDNRVEWLELEYAATALGAWFVPVNTWFRSRELLHVIRDSGMRVLIWNDSVLGHDMLPLLRELLPELDHNPPGAWRSQRFPALETVVGIGDAPWPQGVVGWDCVLAGAAGVSDEELARRYVAVSADEIALVMYTSGTTGAPKGAMIPHGGLVSHIGVWARHLELEPSDRSILASPLFWSFGCTVNAFVPLHAGSMVVLQERFEPERFLRDIHEHGCTHLQGVPSQYEIALNHPDSRRYDLSRLRLIQIGASKSAEELPRRLIERAPHARMLSAYGLTEATAVSTWTDLGDPIEDVMRTIGHAADDNDVIVVEPNGSRQLPAGEVGELWIRGEHVMRGYLGDAEANARSLRDGWLRTGDLVVSDDRGYFTFVGRQVDAYKRGGMNVYPAEVEALLVDHPAVQAAAVIGIPDERLGEVGLAFVVPAPGQVVAGDELRRFCASQLAAYKVPSAVRVVDEMPMTPTGKVQKFKLREQAG
jgi:fatty-acyl-CoA synthase